MKSLHAVHQFLAIINFLFRLRLQIHTDCLSSEKSNCLATNLTYALYKYKAFSPDNIGMLCSKLRSSFFCNDFLCLYGSQSRRARYARVRCKTRGSVGHSLVNGSTVNYSIGAQFNQIMNSQKEIFPLLCMSILAKALSMSWL